MPDRLRIAGSGEGGHGLSEQPGQAAEVPRSVGPDPRFQVGRITEPGDQVRIGVLIRFPRAIQVTKEPTHVGPADHFADHPERSDPFTECSGAPVPRPRPGDGSPAHRTEPQGVNPHLAAQSR